MSIHIGDLLEQLVKTRVLGNEWDNLRQNRVYKVEWCEGESVGSSEVLY